jgi:hypothetical protein
MQKHKGEDRRFKQKDASIQEQSRQMFLESSVSNQNTSDDEAKSLINLGRECMKLSRRHFCYFRQKPRNSYFHGPTVGQPAGPPELRVDAVPSDAA